MQGSVFDEAAFFAAIAAGGSRALLIGRRALVALGLPVLTADYDFWIHLDDVERFNDSLAPFDLRPSRAPAETRSHGRYVLQNDEHVDVLVAKTVTTVDGVRLSFDEVWTRRRILDIGGSDVAVPSLDDLIVTKRFAARPKDLEDLRLLEVLRSTEDKK